MEGKALAIHHKSQSGTVGLTHPRYATYDRTRRSFKVYFYQNFISNACHGLDALIGYINKFFEGRLVDC